MMVSTSARNRNQALVIIECLLGMPPLVQAGEAVVGTPAPQFSAIDTTGQSRRLSDWRGRYVVLEWFNPECPFVKKHYDSGNMQRLQEAYTAKGVVWLSLDSSAPGKQGHLSPAQAHAFVQQRHAHPTAVLLDPDGSLGKLYGAKTTPHLFIVNPEGVLIYAGAIDDTPSADPRDISRARNYVQQALDEAMSGQSVSTPATQSYGCSVKY